MDIDTFNNMDQEKAKSLLAQCNGSSTWQETMLTQRPFSELEELLTKGKEEWWSCSHKDRLEAFDHHPRIGDLETLRKKFQSGQEKKEQSGINNAAENTLQELAEKNEIYHQRFGYIFIVFASGKSAREMADILNERLGNDPETEIKIATEELWKITEKRLKNLFL